MVYTQEQLLKAVREAGRTGQPFSVGEVRAQLGLKSRDKRELKRFRSRLRECLTGLGTHVEKCGPHSYRLTDVSALPAPRSPAQPPRPAASARLAPPPAAPVQAPVEAEMRSTLRDRVGITPRAAEPTQRTVTLQPAAASADAGPGLGSRVSAWLARVRGRNQNTAATALSRLALDLQPNASHFQYQWVDGDLRVKRQ
jgi:hypothetical protein